MKFSFEIKDKDVGGRIGLLEINNKKIETPALMPVYSIKNPVISISEFSKFKTDILMTNAYNIFQNDELRQEIVTKGIHKFLGFPGLIAVDSGSYQLMNYGSIDISNSKILAFEESIKADIGSFLDIPTLPDVYKPRAEEDLKTTLERAREAEKATFVVNAAVQGSKFLDLRAKSAKEMSKRFDMIAIGGIVRFMESYRFSELVDIIATVKKNIKTNKLVHAFGLGHPMIFGLAVALGCDLFDSAAYALYAKDGRYITANGTKKISELEYLPCTCPVCLNHTVKELDVKLIAEHNLYASIEEIKKIKQAIKENNLWEYIAMRSIAHPNLYAAVRRMSKYKKYLSEIDTISKHSALFSFSCFDSIRTEIYNAKRRIKNTRSENLVSVKPFGKVPEEILDMYPFNAFSFSRSEDIDKIRQIMNYQFGFGAEKVLDKFNLRIKRSKATKRIRWIFSGKDMIASVRASDHFIIPHKILASELHRFFKYPKLRVVIDDEAVEFVKKGKSVFAKFVCDVDKNLRSGDECLIVDLKDNLINTGTLVLSPKECMDFKRGIAVRTRNFKKN